MCDAWATTSSAASQTNGPVRSSMPAMRQVNPIKILSSRILAVPFVPLAANEYCCRGYCIDLLIELSKRINFTYDLALSPDGQFGHYILRNNTGAMTLRKEWTGLIGELVNERAE